MTEFTTDRGLPLSDPAFVRGWAECRKALSGSQLMSDPASAGYALKPTYNMLLLDGDLHQAVRRLVTAYLTRARVDAVGSRLEETGATLVRSLLDRPDVDLMADLAEPLVLEGILSTMDVPEDRRPPLGALARRMLGLLEPELPAEVRRGAASAALRATILFERDGSAGTATGFHAVLEDAARDGVIPVRLARSTPVVMLHGGYENPLNQLGCLIAWAVADPDRFRAAAASAPAVLFDEVLRVFSPVRLAARWVAADGTDGADGADGADGGDLPLNRGTFVLVDLESANRDGRHFPAAGEVDLSKRRGHLGFGYGRHMCPGTGLARLEGQVLVRALSSLPVDLLREFTVEWRDGTLARGPARIARK
jgi:cytochrome P450